MIYNQSLLLLISIFTSTLKNIFEKSITHHVKTSNEIQFGDQEVKISFKYLLENSDNITDSFANIIIEKKEISFQDLQSSIRAFKDYLNITVKIDSNHTNNIIFGLASRNIIAHTYPYKASEKFMIQIRNANERDIKKDIKKDEFLNFNITELEILTKSLKLFIENLTNQIIEKYTS